MVEADTGVGPLSGHGVAIAMLAIVIGTGIAVAYAASDGRIFDPFFSPPSSDGTANQVDDQNQNNVGAEPGADSRNALGGESINPDDDGIGAQSSTSETERNFNGLSEEEEKQQRLLLIGNFDWRGISVENAAETQDIIDGLMQMQQQQINNRAGLEYDLSANASTGIKFVIYEQVLIEEDDRFISINEPGAESISDEEQEDEGPDIDADPDIPDNGQEIIDLVEGSEQQGDDTTNSEEEEEEGAQEDEEQASNNQTNTSTEEPDEGADDEDDGSNSSGGSGSEDNVGDDGGQIDDEPSGGSGGEGNSTTNVD